MATVRQTDLTVRSVITHLDASGRPEGEDEITELRVGASVSSEADGTVRLFYYEDAEGDRTVCSVTVTPTAVTVQRRGASVADMRFSDEECRGQYAVGPYAFPMVIRTRRIRQTLVNGRGTVDVFYDMELGADSRRVHLRMTL